jgi:hypothetical protein
MGLLFSERADIANHAASATEQSPNAEIVVSA